MAELLVSYRLGSDFDGRAPGRATTHTDVVNTLRTLHRWLGTLWIGRASETGAEFESAGLSEQMQKELRMVAVSALSSEDSRCHGRFSNEVLWPLCHLSLEKVLFDARRDWIGYVKVNEQFANAVAERYHPGDWVWIHDYELMLVPGMLRARHANAQIGFFLHLPFPPPDLFRTLPWREELLRGLLGADLIGMQTQSYATHFRACAAELLGLEGQTGSLEYDARPVGVGCYPAGVELSDIQALASSPWVAAEVARIRSAAKNKTILLSVDGLDYTRGIRRRVSAIGQLLDRRPLLRERVHFLQLGIPRHAHRERAQHQRLVNEMVSTVNGQFGSMVWLPIHTLHGAVPLRELVALYRAADVLLVTPLREGMNLFAKEYVAARDDEQGVLILSEFSGAAAELSESLLVNPYDLDGLSSAILHAIEMPPAESRARMGALRARVAQNDLRNWANTFLSDLKATTRVVAAGIGPSLDGLNRE